MRVRGGLSAMTTRGTNRQPFLEIKVRGRVMTLRKACSNQGFHASFEFGTPEACCPDLLGLLRYVNCWQSPLQRDCMRTSDEKQNTSTSILGEVLPVLSDVNRTEAQTLRDHLGPDTKSMG
ncbi:hypothetical protein HBI56_006610 [Parastagonospora nodorum]|nr:hypothetical protein HBI06_055170 [Parastagonospora nodorum]KAH4249593.1 hypothetical protein HBI05_007400 [Parastagonospora nodorum]KAH4823110.1 hypothetical protein HBH61_007300 [Parastagonospora nodorum]KAH4994792.1 hypothetical protein HBI76_006650 [Parastagonospora nodorum]KAH5170274.1 hypothetical protein HBI73_006210 [Parastagonospora nodorum]